MVVDTTNGRMGPFSPPLLCFLAFAPFSLNYYAYRQTATSYHHPVCVLGDSDTCSSVPEFKARFYVNLTNGHTDALYAMSFVDLFVLIKEGGGEGQNLKSCRCAALPPTYYSIGNEQITVIY